MFKVVGLVAAIVLGAVITPSGAQALPLINSGTLKSDAVLLVREGCGLGFQYSVRLRRCVASTPGSVVRDIARDVRCGPGFRFSDRLRRCVRI